MSNLANGLTIHAAKGEPAEFRWFGKVIADTTALAILDAANEQARTCAKAQLLFMGRLEDALSKDAQEEGCNA